MARKKKPVEPTAAVPPAAIEPVPPAAADPLPAAATDGPAVGERAFAPPGPRWFQSVALTDRTDGPRMRLGRDGRFQQMAIAFDEKPTAESRNRLHDAGWKWRGAEGTWTKQLEADRRATGHQDAERLFADLARVERRDRQIGEEVGAVRH